MSAQRDGHPQVTLLGATGSIGDSTLDVVARHPDRFAVAALAAHSQCGEAARRCAGAFGRATPRWSTRTPRARCEPALRARRHRHAKCCAGAAGLVAVAALPEVDTVLAAIVGAAGLAPTLAAARAGKRILLANKEALVMGGALFMEAVRARRRDAAADRQRAQRHLPVPARATTRATRGARACGASC